MKDYIFKISNLLHGALDGQRARSKPHAPFSNLALQSSPRHLPCRLFMSISSYTKTTLQKVMSKPPVTIICFEI